MTVVRIVTDLVTLGVTIDGDAVTRIRFHDDAGGPPDTVLARRVETELQEYAAGTRTAFTFPIAPRGTPFQERVWAALCTIPYGTVRSYGEVARAIGRPTASRAVGTANHHNPLPIVIPCHRVVAKDGTLAGFGGGVALKRQLLELEGAWNQAGQLALL